MMLPIKDAGESGHTRTKCYFDNFMMLLVFSDVAGFTEVTCPFFVSDIATTLFENAVASTDVPPSPCHG